MNLKYQMREQKMKTIEHEIRKMKKEITLNDIEQENNTNQIRLVQQRVMAQHLLNVVDDIDAVARAHKILFDAYVKQMGLDNKGAVELNYE